jgi:hypothetical protein
MPLDQPMIGAEFARHHSMIQPNFDEETAIVDLV